MRNEYSVHSLNIHYETLARSMQNTWEPQAKIRFWILLAKAPVVFQASLLGFLESFLLTQWAQFPPYTRQGHTGDQPQETKGLMWGALLAYFICRTG